MPNQDPSRKSAHQLPEIREIEILLQREARRPVPQEKESEHFADFGLPVRWLQMLDLPPDIFSRSVSWEEVVVQSARLLPQLIERSLALFKNDDLDYKNIAEEITRYLGEEDKPTNSDAIFVFGSKSLSRIETAVDLYKKHFSLRIFISGGMPIYDQREQSEAEVYKKYAIDHGVPEDAILIHDGALTVADNVRGGLNRMDELKVAHSSLILVTAWFAMRRSWATMMKYAPQETKLYRTNAPVTVGGDHDPTGWWKNEKGINIIFNEFVKMRISQGLNSS